MAGITTRYRNQQPFSVARNTGGSITECVPRVKKRIEPPHEQTNLTTRERPWERIGVGAAMYNHLAQLMSARDAAEQSSPRPSSGASAPARENETRPQAVARQVPKLSRCEGKCIDAMIELGAWNSEHPAKHKQISKKTRGHESSIACRTELRRLRKRGLITSTGSPQGGFFFTPKGNAFARERIREREAEHMQRQGDC